ncbi:unnamed protein product [Albugo candida]|uniref:Uncharacterized protein n=1 Tax=Albugo candida TaxID=65357 RepID=A0A024G9Z2_9STRA|nr:unnamed protein product [Albugo candida]|eukprot:CCI43696.1 unnamed protein product [Albugo candida]
MKKFSSYLSFEGCSTCPYDINSSDFLIEKACFFFFDFRASGVTFYQFGLNLCVASISPVEAVDYWVVEADFVELNNKYQIRLFQWQHKKCCFTSVSSGWGYVNDQRNDRGSASLFKSLLMTFAQTHYFVFLILDARMMFLYTRYSGSDFACLKKVRNGSLHTDSHRRFVMNKLITNRDHLDIWRSIQNDQVISSTLTRYQVRTIHRLTHENHYCLTQAPAQMNNGSLSADNQSTH